VLSFIYECEFLEKDKIIGIVNSKKPGERGV
jgi:hypothetical protein